MGYVYAAMWLIAGLILILKLSKENKIFYIAGGFFLLLGAWWGLDAAFPAWGMFKGALGIAIKVITGIVLVVLSVFFYKTNRAEREKQEKKKEK